MNHKFINSLMPILPYRQPEILENMLDVIQVLEKENVQSVLLVTDKGIRGLGLTAQLEQLLAEHQIACAVYDGTQANPTTANVDEAKALYLQNNCQALISFGSSSSIDCAKGAQSLGSKNYGKIINEKHYRRLLGLIDPQKVVCGGGHDEAACRIEPTVMAGVTWEDAVMQEEIFGPILPILTYEDLEQAIGIIEARPRPLALYLYTEDKAVADRVLTKCRFGGGCINDCIIHLATSEMPFGGVGESGMGGYHGKFGFEEFPHLRSIVDKKTWIDLPARYQPYTKENYALMRNAMK